MSYVIKQTTKYDDGFVSSGYFLRASLFFEIGSKCDAKRFETKKAARDQIKAFPKSKNRSYEIEED